MGPLAQNPAVYPPLLAPASDDMNPLYVAIIWHMHQPYYRQPGTDLALLPWVRLHATKDYLHMAQVAAAYDRVHVTFTLVPSLAEQLQDYATGRLADRVMTLAEASYFSPDDKRYLLNICYSIQHPIIRSHPAYAALLDRRPLALANPDYFSEQTYRDLIVWFNLAWTDPNLLEQDPLLRRLVAKGENFTLAEGRGLIGRHREIMGEVLPTYRRLQDAGQMEVVTVPYFHPILPLLVDSDSARLPSPGLPAPAPPYRFPADAASQIADGVALHTGALGRPPRGMWPSEGAVTPEVVRLAASAGLNWLATDEAVLGRSLGVYFGRDGGEFVQQPELLYAPYRVATPDGDVAVVFRDHNLSDRIGFTYQGLGGEQAAEDMVVRLKHIHHQLRHAERPGLVSIILDGENCWEHYEHNGDVFLHALYSRLQRDPDLRAVTVSEYLDAFGPKATLPSLAPGSWIRGDFTTWIGDPEHTEAWTRLRDLRSAFETWLAGAADAASIAEARRYVYAAEGSDWFWWYSRNNSSDQDALFDRLYLDYLAAGYRAIGMEPPDGALTPIQGLNARPRPRPRLLTPRLTADADASTQWAKAQVLLPAASTGAMQQAGGVIQALRVANDATCLYLRVDLSAPVVYHHVAIFCRGQGGDYLLSLGREQSTVFLYRSIDGTYASQGALACARSERVIEMAIPLARLGLAPLAPETQVALSLHIDDHTPRAEHLPAGGEQVVHLATESVSKSVFG